jgi:hypothetical protein
MSLPALLLSINGLRIGVRGEGSADDPLTVSESEDEDSPSSGGGPDEGSKRKPDQPGPSGDSTVERPRNRQRASDGVRDGVYSDWASNTMDNSSYTIRRLGMTKLDRYKTHDEDFIEVEVACSLFSRLSTAVSTFHNDRGEPDDWQFHNPTKHKYLTSENPEMDQPWLEARLNHQTNEWEVFNHEGRHRSAWVCNHMGYSNLTVLIGLHWNAAEDSDIAGAVVMDIFTGSGAKAQLVRNTRAGRVEFKLNDVTPPPE